MLCNINNIALAKHCWVMKLGEFKSDQIHFAR